MPLQLRLIAEFRILNIVDSNFGIRSFVVGLGLQGKNKFLLIIIRPINFICFVGSLTDDGRNGNSWY